MSEQDHSFGVAYTPTSVATQDFEVVRAPFSVPVLEQLGVRWIRVFWLDYTNVLRFRIISRSFFKKLLKFPRPGIPIAKITFSVVHLIMVEGMSTTGEYLYVFDTSSFRLCPYTPGHASIMGFFQLKVPPPTIGLNPIPECPRGILKRIVDDAQAKAGVAFLVGFESEFILLRSTKPITTGNNGDYACAAKIPSGSIETKVLEEIAEGLEAAGIEVQQYHGEAAPGQYEMITGPLTPLEAADALVNTRELIYNVAAKHGLRATFAPRLHKFTCGTAAHTHISVHNTGKPAKPRDSDASLAPTLTSTERSFLQGVLSHIPAICALTLPIPQSYDRVHDGVWSGGTYTSWGTDNRETPVRLSGSKGSHHFEVRCVDGTSNPYLALAAIIAAGTRGIVDDVVLQSGDCVTPVAFMSEEERKAKGVQNATRLPRTVEEARQNLQEDVDLKSALGEKFVDDFVKVNKLLGKCLVLENEEATLEKLVNFY